MVNLPEDVFKIVNDPKSVKVLATKSAEGDVHAIVVGSVTAPNPSTIAFGAILMKRSSKNLEGMRERHEMASVLVNKDVQAFEIKASIKSFLTSGQLLDNMNIELKKNGLSARGIWILEPQEIWNQSASYEAGKRIA